MLRKLLIAGLLVLMFTFTASAYTLVFRDGRRIDISSEFTLTRTTLTFEVSPGFNQTVLLTIVDIPATERANNESAGSFFKHRPEDQPQPAPAPVGPALGDRPGLHLPPPHRLRPPAGTLCAGQPAPRLR